MQPQALSALSPEELAAWATAAGFPPYRARQLDLALRRRAVYVWGDVTELPLADRQALEGRYRLRTLEVVRHLRSARDGTEKVLFRRLDGGTIESVLIRGRNADSGRRLTVCVSSQVGCPAGCTFCATGLAGLMGNLSAAEIVDQVQYFVGRVRPAGERVTNVVFMGMGEPFLNVAAVRASIERLTDERGLGLGARRLTVSTVGIVPQIRAFTEWGGQVKLAVSLHAPNDDLRSSLVPYNRHFPIADLMEAAMAYVRLTRRRVSFEYVLLRGVNDARGLARELARLLVPFGGLAHVNLIPWNPFREGRFVRSEAPDTVAFAEELQRACVNATIRHSRGLDINAACGQLREQANRAS